MEFFYHPEPISVGKATLFHAWKLLKRGLTEEYSIMLQVCSSVVGYILSISTLL